MEQDSEIDLPSGLMDGLRQAVRQSPINQDDAFDLVRRTVTVGHATIPVANLRALWVIAAMAEKLDENDPLAVLCLLWVLNNQDKEEVLKAADEPPGMEKLSELAASIDLVDLPDYIAALELMLGLSRGKVLPAAEGGCP